MKVVECEKEVRGQGRIDEAELKQDEKKRRLKM